MKVTVQLAPLILLVSRALAATYTQKGCYSQSDLSSYLTSKGSYTWQSNSHCQQECSGYAIAATSDGSNCYCGNTLPSSIESVSSSKCSTNCNGWPSEKCGGDGYLSVYTTGDEDTGSVSSSSSADSTRSSADTSSSSTSSKTTNSATSSTSTGTSSSATSSSSTSSSNSKSSSNTSPSSTSISSSTPTTQVSIITSIISASNSASTSVQTSTASASQSSSSSSASSSSIANNTDSNSKSSSGGLSKGAIAGIAVGVSLAVLALIGLLVFLFIRSRRSNSDDEIDEKSGGHSTPIHNDMSFYHPQSRTRTDGVIPSMGTYDDHHDDFDQPTPIMPVLGRKRLSNGSLPDERHQKTLRVVNPDEHTLNDTTLRQDDYSDSDDSDFGKFRA